MLMSFIGCIGVLMRGTGLEDLLGCAFAGVPNMMNCKAWPNALRADRMVTSALLRRRYTIRFARTEPADCPVHGSIVTCDMSLECPAHVKIG